MATVSFRDEGDLNRALDLSPQERQFRGRCVRLDGSFEGFTALSDGDRFDIIAIHGLTGHAFDTWQDYNSSFMWLRDCLPECFPDARILLYGYSADILSSALAGRPSAWSDILSTALIGRLSALSDMFLEDLRRERDFEMRSRPLIIIAHSLGGLIIKQALLSPGKRTDVRYTDIFTAIRGIMFFGTPHHKGGDISTMVLACDILQAFNINGLVDALRVWDVKPLLLFNSTDEFRRVVNELGISIHTFVEEGRIKIVPWPIQQNIQLVEEESASLGAAHERKVFVQANHADLCRFEDPSYPAYVAVCKGIYDLTAEILSNPTERDSTNGPALSSAPASVPALLSLEYPPFIADNELHHTRAKMEELSDPGDSSSVEYLSPGTADQMAVMSMSGLSSADDDGQGIDAILKTLTECHVRMESAARMANMYKRSLGQLALLCASFTNNIAKDISRTTHLHDVTGILEWYQRACVLAETTGISTDVVAGLVRATRMKNALFELCLDWPPEIRQHSINIFPTQISFRPDLDETVEAFRTALRSKRDFNRLLALEGDEAQSFVEYVDKILCIIDNHDRLWRQSLDMLRTLCGKNEICPSSFTLPEKFLQKHSDRPIASGGFADVWRGTYQGKDVAIKVWRFHGRDITPRVLKDFCKEAVVLRYLKHPNITSFIGIETVVFPLCLVCEWMPLGTLVSYLLQHPNTNRLDLLVDVTAGLTYLHAMDIAHGDLKGANILVNQRRRACLCDFGLAAFRYENRTACMPTPSVDGGTTRWMAPEIMDPEAFGLERARSSKEGDVYAFSMVMWEVFTGQFPFAKFKHEGTVIKKVLEGSRPERPSEAAGLGLSDVVWDVMQRGWHADRRERPAITRVREQLDDAIDEVRDFT
ncbi:kinase-like protein [Obba rivulosa]|uniref:Kinase-like protein n=1 Tax=Obba rivulosa TaxID=1052685 RepID=A0A8E2ASU6_9APHY|nr:kinase-like protein [Obba rivulosa]